MAKHPHYVNNQMVLSVHLVTSTTEELKYSSARYTFEVVHYVAGVAVAFGWS
jgi:hypothetical protein